MLRLKEKLSVRKQIFFSLFISLNCVFCLAVSNKIAEDTLSQSNGIVFNSMKYGKSKWQGPIHNKLLYPWFSTSTQSPNKQEYMKLIELQRKYGVKYIGYYYSATTSYPSESIPDHRKFPEVSIPPKAIKYSWVIKDAKNQPITWGNQKDRFFLEVGLKEVQDAILIRAVNSAKSSGANALFLDNWYYKYWAPSNRSKQQWSEECLSFLIRARELTTANNLKLIVNSATSVELFVEFAPYLDGISYEMGAHPYRLKTKGRYEEELASYDKVMTMGKSIFLWTDRLKDNGGRWDEDGRKVAATAMLVMPKDQPYWGGIYVANPRYEVWPVGGWAMWPEQLGNPLGPREWDGDTVIRKFERGLISVTVGEKPKFSISIEY